MAKKLIEQKMHLNDEEKQLKIQIENDFNQIKSQVETNINEIKSITREHFSEIRGKVELRKIKLKKRIDEISNDLIQKLMNEEENLLKEINENLLDKSRLIQNL